MQLLHLVLAGGMFVAFIFDLLCGKVLLGNEELFVKEIAQAV